MPTETLDSGLHEIPLHKNANITRLLADTSASPPEYITANSPNGDVLTLIPVHETPPPHLYNLFNTAPPESFTECGWTPHETPTETRNYRRKSQSNWGDKYEYTIYHNNDAVGVTKISTRANSDCLLGIWLHNDYWGRGISGLRADITIHLAFTHIGVDTITIGCLTGHTPSIRAIEKYLYRYNGLYYGARPIEQSIFRPNKTGLTPDHKYLLPYENFLTQQHGLTCTIPGLNYEDLQFAETAVRTPE